MDQAPYAAVTMQNVPTVTGIVLSGYSHVRFRTQAALGSPGIISDNQDLFSSPPGEAKR